MKVGDFFLLKGVRIDDYDCLNDRTQTKVCTEKERPAKDLKRVSRKEERKNRKEGRRLGIYTTVKRREMEMRD